MTWHLIFCYNSFTTNSSLFSSFRAPAHTMYGSVLLFRRWLAFWILVHSKLSDSCWCTVHDKQCHSKNMQNNICMNKWCHLFRDNMLRWFPNEYEYISVSKTWTGWFMCKEFLIQRNFSLNRHRHISSYGNFLWFVGAFNFNLDKATFGTHTFTLPMQWNSNFFFSAKSNSYGNICLWHCYRNGNAANLSLIRLWGGKSAAVGKRESVTYLAWSWVLMNFEKWIDFMSSNSIFPQMKNWQQLTLNFSFTHANSIASDHNF